jgi:signal transduction histidine kinase/PAS domain-containing protein
VHPGDTVVLGELIARTSAGKASGELRLMRGDGSSVPVQLSLGLLRSGGFDGICAIATDLTEQKRREQAEADDRLTQAIIDHAAEPIVVCDAEGRVIRANRQAADVFGADIEGSLLEERCARMLSFTELTAAATSALVKRKDVALVRPDGRQLFLSVGARPTDSESIGGDRKWVVTLADVSDRVRLAERRSLLQSLTASLSRAMSGKEVGEVVLHQALPALGASAGGVVLVEEEAREFVSLGIGGHPDEVIAAWQRHPMGVGTPADDVVRTKRPVLLSTMAEWEQRYPSVAPRIQRLGLPVFAGIPACLGDRVLAVVGLNLRAGRQLDPEDMELLEAFADQCAQALERIRLYEAQQAARAEAEAANRAKTEFLATMSHELRTPLNAIGGYADLMLAAVHGPLPPAYSDYARRLKTSQQHLLGLINAVLDFARVEAGHVTYAIEAMSLTHLLADIEPMVEPQTRLRGLSLSWEPIDETLRVLGDAEKVRQILLNLLSNAIKFCEPGDRIIVSAAATADRVAIRVADTGAGIPEDRLERIFEPFVQGHTQQGGQSEGIGLGLAISRELAEGMGGSLAVESAVGKGSVFTLELNRVVD